MILLNRGWVKNDWGKTDRYTGKAPVIPLELENQMVDKSLKLADQGFGLSKRKLTARAGQLC